jgi:ADP-ribose pyrophosphatase YjhB (NUDIX family)
MMNRPIRNSAKALIIKEGKMLAIKLDDNGDVFYIMPGGGQESEEQLSDAVYREVAEELGIEVIPKELVFVIEGVHGEWFHRVDLVFLCEYVGEIPDAVLHGDTNQTGYDWLDIETLISQPLYPSKLRRQIINIYHGEKYKTYLGNEEAGDSECLE